MKTKKMNLLKCKKMKQLRSYGLAIMILLNSCSKEKPISNLAIEVEQTSEYLSLESTNSHLRQLALSLNTVIQNQEVRELLQKEIAKKFDGDYEVLYKDITHEKIGNITLSEVLETSTFSYKKDAVDLSDISKALPQTQISMPLHFDTWDAANQIPMVAYISYSAEAEENIDYIEAFDQNGQSHFLSANEAPDEPVLIVNLNERSDKYGNLLAQYVHPFSNKAETTASGNTVYTKRIKANNLYESWVLGKAEVRQYVGRPIQCDDELDLQSYNGTEIKQNEKEQWITVGDQACVWTFSESFVMVLFYESDGDIFNLDEVSLPYNNCLYYVDFPIFKSDDLMGYSVVFKSDLTYTSSTSPYKYSTSTNDVEFEMYLK